MRHKRGIPCPSYDVRVDRRSIFGNPFDHRKLGITRAESVAKYKEYFYKRIQTDPRFLEAVLVLKDKVLGCWCLPLECHATIIAEYLNNLCTSTPIQPVSVPVPENLWTQFFSGAVESSSAT